MHLHGGLAQCLPSSPPRGRAMKQWQVEEACCFAARLEPRTDCLKAPGSEPQGLQLGGYSCVPGGLAATAPAQPSCGDYVRTLDLRHCRAPQGLVSLEPQGGQSSRVVSPPNAVSRGH